MHEGVGFNPCHQWLSHDKLTTEFHRPVLSNKTRPNCNECVWATPCFGDCLGAGGLCPVGEIDESQKYRSRTGGLWGGQIRHNRATHTVARPSECTATNIFHQQREPAPMLEYILRDSISACCCYTITTCGWFVWMGIDWHMCKAIQFVHPLEAVVCGTKLRIFFLNETSFILIALKALIYIDRYTFTSSPWTKSPEKIRSYNQISWKFTQRKKDGDNSTINNLDRKVIHIAY